MDKTFVIPEKVYEYLRKKLSSKQSFTRTLNLLSWITKHKEQALQIIENVKTRDKLTQRYFLRFIPAHGDLQFAFEQAIKRREQEKRQRRLLQRFLQATRRGGFKFEFKGLPVKITFSEKYNVYQAEFHVQGEKITAFLAKKLISYTLEEMLEGNRLWHQAVQLIQYRGKAYSPRQPVGKLLLDAIEKNIHPEVNAVINWEGATLTKPR
ncbi:MAG: hypothetical protein ACTSV6_01925 [Candidatus Heimdallarchaeota archaeon]